ncbi:MAG TPA: glycoside hydrolase family 2 TIM barrel-domain containing protein [Longimicrobiales bacterium]|nr:glycoside hydrolase family 2 TIM barrel-domain containing protein [Longimicrobiales bacterium]
MRRRDFIQALTVASATTALDPADAAARWARARELTARSTPTVRRLDTGWRFLRGDPAGAQFPSHGDSEWQDVVLPHSARVEALVIGPKGSPTWQWQGVCWYRRAFQIPSDAAGKKIFLQFDGAMNVAQVFLGAGEPIGRHPGGYLPFVMDISDRVRPGAQHLLAVRLDNTDDPITGPKPLEILDFNMYGGLYRHVHLIVKDRLRITHPIPLTRGLRERRPPEPYEPASGGVFVDFPEASPERALVRVRTHVRNDHDEHRRFDLYTWIIGATDENVRTETARDLVLPPHGSVQVEQVIEVDRPRLWSPRRPELYTLRTEILVAGDAVDSEETRIGIRRIGFERDAFVINGERMFLRGTNRHQEYPYVGYALSDAAQYRDARLIKDAGFDYVRLSHYPHSPAFMDACDELGLVVMNCIPGWQYFGEDPEFAELQYRNTRELIRRDRNHPCVVLWEVSLNETAMPPEFIETTQRIAHEEYPGDQMFTCGWMKGYDVFIRARQHGGCPPDDPQPCVVSEYGDWEYYAMTAGLNQEAFQALSADEQNSRQLRWHGERALLQQATNFQEAHDDNRAGPAFGDGLWVMFDYNRGYAPDIESSGAADIFRLPKYSYFFFASQRDPGIPDSGFRMPDGQSSAFRNRGGRDGALAFIASEWTPASSTRVRVFSNCEEVELRLNGRVVARQRPDRDRISTHLAHPPFTFAIGAFEAGTLAAFGYIAGAEAAVHAVRTPERIQNLRAWVDFAGRDAQTEGKDTLIAHASLEDAHGTIVADAWENVAFGVTGDARLIGANPFSSDAGIASVVVETRPGAASAALYALLLIDGPGGRILAASTRVVGSEPAPHEVRRTGTGAELLVSGTVVARWDRGTPRFRMRGSEAPDRRDPFRHG